MSKVEYTLNDIAKKYSNLKPSVKVEILWSALDYMSQYNGRSNYYCIALAMGYETTDGDIWVNQ